MKASIHGIGTVGGFGSGIDALEKALMASPPKGQWVEFETSKGLVRVPGLKADISALSTHVPVRTLRRMGHISRVALMAAYLSLADANMLEPKHRGRLGIVVATGYGATCNDFDFQHLSNDGADFSGSPIKFANSVHNATAASISIALKDNGPNHSVSHLDMSFPSAVLTAIQWLREERVDTVLVGGVDEFCKALAYAQQYQSNTKDRQARHQPMVGEGACFFVLTGSQGKSAPYGFIDQVAIERWNQKSGKLPKASAYLIGTQDAVCHSQKLAEMLPADAMIGCYPHIYGLMPVGSAFDLAIGTLSLKHKKLFPSTWLPSPEAAIPGGPICCVQLGVGGTCGWITLIN